MLFSHEVMSHSFVTPWTVASQAPLSMGFPRHEYWSGLLFPSPGDLPHPGIEPYCPALSGGLFPAEPLGNPKIEYLGLIARDLDPESLKVRPKNMHFFVFSFLATVHGQGIFVP